MINGVRSAKAKQVRKSCLDVPKMSGICRAAIQTAHTHDLLGRFPHVSIQKLKIIPNCEMSIFS